jgi:hypothetical protein
MAPFFVALDLLLYDVTLANTAALALDPEPVTKIAFLSSEIIVSAADILVVYAELSYLHWVATGEPLTRENWTDWAMRP